MDLDNLELEDEESQKPTTIADFINKKLAALDKEKGKIRGENDDGWGILPDLLIEKILSFLSMRDRYVCSMVCLQWNRAFYMQKVWHVFELGDNTLTRRKYNYYSGWQYCLDHLRTQMFLMKIGKFIRRIILHPMCNLFSLYEFINMVSYYAERYEADKSGPNLNRIYSLRFSFWCGDFGAKKEDETQCQQIYGTGGELLEALKRLMRNLKEMRELELIDLLLDPHDAVHLLDDVCVALCEKLEKLTLINATKIPFIFLHPGCFINLFVLKITPQNLSEELIQMLNDNCQYLESLHIIQNNFTESAISVSYKAWKIVKNKFSVYLRTIGKIDTEIIWQEKAPVKSIIYECPNTKISWDSILTVIDLYSFSLQEYGHFGLSKFNKSRRFEKRCDSIILTLVRKCIYLNTLFIRENLSTSTSLLIASMCPNLKYFYIRENGLILKCDYAQHNLDLDYNFVQWIKLNSKSYQKTTSEIGKLLGYEWSPLSDKQYKEICKNRVAY